MPNPTIINAANISAAAGVETWLDGGGPSWNSWIAGRLNVPGKYVEFALARFNEEPAGTIGVYVAFYPTEGKTIPPFPVSVEDPCATLGNPIADLYEAVAIDSNGNKVWTPETVKRIAETLKKLSA